MEWLNYHHLLYFSVIARTGSLSRAAKELGVTHSTLSTQLRSLEAFLGSPLFERRGRGLSLTPFGVEVASYAAEIFRAGAELVEVARGKKPAARGPLGVGVAARLPKSIVHHLIEPALRLEPGVPIEIRQDRQDLLLEELAAGKLHVVLADAPPRASALHLHTRLLGETDVLLYGSRALARRHGRAFPSGLDGAPVVLPNAGALRRAIDRWFTEHRVRPRATVEVDDSGLLRVFGLQGHGIFPIRAVLRTEVDEKGDAVCLGAMEGVRERYYVTVVERRIRHPGVAAIVEHARELLDHAAARPRAGGGGARRSSRRPSGPATKTS